MKFFRRLLSKFRSWRCSKGHHRHYVQEIATRSWAVVNRELRCSHCNYREELPCRFNDD